MIQNKQKIINGNFTSRDMFTGSVNSMSQNVKSSNVFMTSRQLLSYYLKPQAFVFSSLDTILFI